MPNVFNSKKTWINSKSGNRSGRWPSIDIDIDIEDLFYVEYTYNK